MAIKHSTKKSFWQTYWQLPGQIRQTADKQFELLADDSKHPSVSFKRLKGANLFSARVTKDYRAVARPIEGGYEWFWIGTHSEYDKLIERLR